jgi:hypothetical protein
LAGRHILDSSPDISPRFSLSFGLVFMVLAFLLYPFFMGDDAFIHLTFAKDILKLHTYSFAGNVTYGSTAPLWPVLVALVGASGVDLVAVARALSGVFGVGAIIVLGKILTWMSLPRHLIYACTLSLALNPFFIRWGLSGMEITAAIFGLLLGYYYGIIRDSGRTDAVLAGSAFGIASLLRPEILLFYGIYVALKLVGERLDFNKTAYRLTGLIPIGTWNAYAWYTFGTMVPNSFRVKARSGLLKFDFSNIVPNVGNFVTGNAPEWIILGMATVLVWAIDVKKPTEGWKQIREDAWLAPLLWIGGFYGYYIFKDVTIITRYSLLLVPFISILTAAALSSALRMPAVRIGSIWMVITVGWFLLMTFLVIKPSCDDFVSGFQKTHYDIASMLKADAEKQKQARAVACPDVGMIGYYSGLPVRDWIGLVDQRRFIYADDSSYISAVKPDYLIVKTAVESEIIPRRANLELLGEYHLSGFGIQAAGTVVNIKVFKMRWPD